MTRQGLSRLIKLAEGLVNECRQLHGAAVRAQVTLEGELARNTEQRRLLLTGQAGLTSASIASCLLALDEKRDRLDSEISEANLAERRARDRVAKALTERKKLEALDRRVSERRRRDEERGVAQRMDALAATLRWQRNKTGRDGEEEFGDATWAQSV